MVVIPFNDLDAMAAALERRDVAAVLVEPALTNIGIVIPDDGGHEAVRSLCTETETLLIIDETHTLSAGHGGMTLSVRHMPDAIVLGRAIAPASPARPSRWREVWQPPEAYSPRTPTRLQVEPTEKDGSECVERVANHADCFAK